MRVTRWLALVAVAGLATAAVAQDAPPKEPVGRGAALHEQWVQGKKTVFTERASLSVISTMAARLGWPLKQIKDSGKEPDYNLKSESFQLFVPDTYTGDEPFGLFVWISAGNSGALPPSWLEVLAERKIIGIGLDNSGNERATWVRLGLAIDAAYNLQKQYKVDPRRVYVSGGSGGGRCASMLGVCFPDAFQGGFYLVGCNSYHVLGPPGEDRVWKPGYVKPGKKYFDLAANRSRHVLLTGETDMNREQTKVYYDAFLKDGFKHMTYIEIPKFGHQMPNKEWFDKGLALLEPTEEVAAVEKPAKAKAPPATRPAPVVSAPVGEPDKLLNMAKLYASNRRYDAARVRLKTLIETYPDSPAAAQGRKLMKDIEGK